MKRLALPALLVGLWIYAWANNTGVLVWSSIAPYQERACFYLIGLSVLKDTRGQARRCRLLARVY